VYPRDVMRVQRSGTPKRVQYLAPHRVNDCSERSLLCDDCVGTSSKVDFWHHHGSDYLQRIRATWIRECLFRPSPSLGLARLSACSDLQVDNMFASCPTERSLSAVPGLHTLCMISDAVASSLPESIRTASPHSSSFEYKR
jgi:hypothetical protein